MAKVGQENGAVGRFAGGVSCGVFEGFFAYEESFNAEGRRDGAMEAGNFCKRSTVGGETEINGGGGVGGAARRGRAG